MRKYAIMALFSLLPLGAEAARLVLRDGTVVTGNFVSGSERTIIFQDSAGVRRRFDVGQVQTIDFDSMTTGSRGDSAFRGEANRMDNRVGDRTLPAGTELQVRTNEAIEANSATGGRTYSALMEKEVTDTTGNIVIPRGSEARLVVRNVNQGGTVTNGNLSLDLESVTANGQRYMVSTSDIERGSDRGLGKNRRTAEMVGGGAVLGTIVGAIAGGGKGAAIGAAVGAGAGAGTQVLTKGDKVRVPAETTLTFRLDQPLQLQAVR
jgi:hypothetical protein